MVRKFRNQNYQKLKRDCQRRGQPFTDPEFPPQADSLFYSGRNDLDIVWKRPGVSPNIQDMYTCYMKCIVMATFVSNGFYECTRCRSSVKILVLLFMV